MTETKKFIPYAWIVLIAIFLIRAPHPAASGSIEPDVYWHLLYGHWIIDHLALPSTDMWTWTMPGKTYYLTQWLGEVAIAVAERLGGELGKQVFAAGLSTLAIFFSYRAACCYLTNRSAAVIAAMIGCTELVSMTCRPHLFTFVGLAALTWIIAAFETTGRKWPLLLVPVITALWANLHGGYSFGLVYLWLVVGTTSVAAFMRNELREKKNIIVLLSVVALVGSLATIINPYGYHVWTNTIAVGALKSVSAGITGEWVPTNMRDEVGFAFFTVMLVTIMAVAFSEKRPEAKDGLTILALMVIGWWAMRLSLMSSILLVPVIAKFLGHTPFYRLAFQNQDKTEGNIRPLAAAVMLVGLGLLGYFLAVTDKGIAARVHRDFPVEEVAYLKQQNFKGTIMNTMEAGGYLIRNLGQPVFLDTRLDLYGDDYFFEFMKAAAGGDNWEAFMDKWSPDLVMIEHSMPLKNLLLQAGTYEVVFKGPRYTLLQKTK